MVKHLKNLVARFALQALTAVVPVFIAACYGMPYAFRTARVVDRDTRGALEGIDVQCLDAGGTVIGSRAVTDRDGLADVKGDCAKLRASDRTHAHRPTTIEVDRAPPHRPPDPVTLELDEVAR
jgi:hypothetical protein